MLLRYFPLASSLGWPTLINRWHRPFESFAEENRPNPRLGDLLCLEVLVLNRPAQKHFVDMPQALHGQRLPSLLWTMSKRMKISSGGPPPLSARRGCRLVPYEPGGMV